MSSLLVYQYNSNFSSDVAGMQVVIATRIFVATIYYKHKQKNKWDYLHATFQIENVHVL